MSAQSNVGRWARSHVKGFTLIEVLVVVAIIALLVSILIPSLTKARDQARRTLCMNNMHQQLLAMGSYGNDHKGFLPWRGWFTYTISEAQREAYGHGSNTDKVLVNLALLIGKHVGKNWDAIYCPSTITKYKDTGGGYPHSKLFDTSSRFTHGGYFYGLPMGSRSGSPRWDLDVYPRDPDKLSGYWMTTLRNKADAAGIPLVKHKGKDIPDLSKLMPRRVQVVVMDFVSGGGATAHKGGFCVAYSDGHARFVKREGFADGGGMDNQEASDVWYDVTVRP